MTIRKEGNSYVLRAKGTGKVLGRHKTKAAAEKQDRAIKSAKATRGRG